MIVTCEWYDLIIWMVFMKGQIENSKCVTECESEWMNERACKWIDCLWEKILKDG